MADVLPRSPLSDGGPNDCRRTLVTPAAGIPPHSTSVVVVAVAVVVVAVVVVVVAVVAVVVVVLAVVVVQTACFNAMSLKETKLCMP